MSSSNWKWITEPVAYGATCDGCKDRLRDSAELVEMSGKQWHVNCLLDYLIAHTIQWPT